MVAGPPFFFFRRDGVDFFEEASPDGPVHGLRGGKLDSLCRLFFGAWVTNAYGKLAQVSFVTHGVSHVPVDFSGGTLERGIVYCCHLCFFKGGIKALLIECVAT